MKKKKLLMLPLTVLFAASLISCGNNNADTTNGNITSGTTSDTNTGETTTTHEHTYSNEYSKDETSHWYSDTCGHNTKKDEAKHTYSEWVVVEDATETTKGSKKRTCEVCGYEDTEEIDVLSHTHKYAETWSSDETKHWYSDTCGHDTKKDEAEHTYTDWVVVNAATTTEEGLERRECSVCGHEQTRNIKRLNTVNITFNSNGGSTVNTINLNIGDTITVVPTKDKCIFLGWYDKTLTTEYDSAPKSDITLYAKWCDLSNYDYEMTGYGITIKKYIGSEKEVVIPEGVKCINPSAFDSCKITSVVIPNTVTIIGSHAFEQCSSLTSVTISSSISSIGDCVFYGCSSLTRVVIPNNVKSIGYRAFYECSALTNITIPSSVTNNKNYAFEECYHLVEVINKSSLNITKGSTNNGYIGYYALEVKKSGESTLVNKEGYLFYTVDNANYLVKYIGNDTELDLPNNYNGNTYTINDYAFYKCSNLTSVTIPDSVTSIGSVAFSQCYHLVEVINKSSLNINKGGYDYGWVGRYALEIKNSGESSIVNKDGYLFYTVDNINYLVGYTENDTELVLPNDYNGESYIINEYAFYNCNSITSITIPDSVTSIGRAAFYNCDNLKYNEYDNAYYLGNENNPYLILVEAKSKTIISCEINENCKFIMSDAFHNCTSLTSVTILDSITSIGDYAFNGCRSLTSITIPSSVTSIGDYAFNGCRSLTSITIPDSVTCIGDNMFYNCTSLTSVTIPDSITSIGDYAFNGCRSLTSITIPSSVTSIGGAAFYGCYHLVEVINKSSLRIKKGSYDFGYVGRYALEVKNSGESSIVNKDGYLFYNDYLVGYTGTETKIVLPNDYNGKSYVINSYAFAECNNLTSVVISSGVTSIGDYAFENCNNLESIIIPSSVKKIGQKAFSSCSKLTSIYYKGSIDEWANLYIGYDNDSFENATRYYYSEVQPTDTYNKYWHYVDGEITKW